MQNRIFSFGPVALTNSAANILNGAITSLSGPVGVTLTQPFILLKRLRIVNKTNAAATFSLYIGATGGSAAGTEFVGYQTSIPANGAYDWFGPAKRLASTDFLTGLASANTTLTIEGDCEIGFS